MREEGRERERAYGRLSMLKRERESVLESERDREKVCVYVCA